MAGEQDEDTLDLSMDDLEEIDFDETHPEIGPERFDFELEALEEPLPPGPSDERRALEREAEQLRSLARRLKLTLVIVGGALSVLMTAGIAEVVGALSGFGGHSFAFAKTPPQRLAATPRDARQAQLVRPEPGPERISPERRAADAATPVTPPAVIVGPAAEPARRGNASTRMPSRASNPARDPDVISPVTVGRDLVAQDLPPRRVVDREIDELAREGPDDPAWVLAALRAGPRLAGTACDRARILETAAWVDDMRAFTHPLGLVDRRRLSLALDGERDACRAERETP